MKRRLIAGLLVLMATSAWADDGERSEQGWYWLDVEMDSKIKIRVLDSGKNDYDDGSLVIYVWRTEEDFATQQPPAYELHLSAERLERLQKTTDRNKDPAMVVHVR